jgi:hypothetical protein
MNAKLLIVPTKNLTYSVRKEKEKTSFSRYNFLSFVNTLKRRKFYDVSLENCAIFITN